VQTLDSEGYFGAFGGQFVPETLMSPLEELGKAYDEARRSSEYVERSEPAAGDLRGTPDRPLPRRDFQRSSARGST